MVKKYIPLTNSLPLGYRQLAPISSSGIDQEGVQKHRELNSQAKRLARNIDRKAEGIPFAEPPRVRRRDWWKSGIAKLRDLDLLSYVNEVHFLSSAKFHLML